MANVFDVNTNKQGLIVYGGEASSDFGMVVSEAPSFERPKRKSTTYTVPGRNGSVVFQQDAWEDVVRNYKVWLAEAVVEDSGGIKSGYLVEKVDAIEAWLNSLKGYQRLEDNFEPDVYRLAYFNGGAGFSDELTMYGEATLSFTCRPERFLKSKPLIHIEVASTTTITVSINGKSITAAVDDYINIDCETMNAYRLATENKNSSISGDFPTIAPGNNGIGITGAVTLIEITPRFYTI